MVKREPGEFAAVPVGSPASKPGEDAALLSVARYREVLEGLRRLVEARRRGLEQLAEFDSAEEIPSAHQVEETLRALQEAEREAAAIANERYASERHAAETRHQEAVTAANVDFMTIAGRIRQRFADETAALERGYEENCWMLSSLLDDDSEENPKRRYESIKGQLRQSEDHLVSRWEDLKATYSRVTELVEERRQGLGSEPVPPDVPRNRQEAMIGFEAAAGIVERNTARLQGQVVPRLFAGWTVVVLALFVWGGLFATTFLLVDFTKLGIRSTEPSMPIILSAGASFAGCVLILLAIWLFAAGRTAKEFAPLRQAMADAQVCHQHWSRLAKEEVKRHEREFRERYEEIVEHRDRSFRRFAAERERSLRDLTATRDRDLEGPTLRRDAAVREASERLNREVGAAEAAHRRETISMRARFEQERERIVGDHDHRVGERAAERGRRIQEIAKTWKAGVASAEAFAQEAKAVDAELFPDWPTLVERDWEPNDAIPDALRIGEYEIRVTPPKGVAALPELDDHTTILRLPAVLPFPGTPSMFLDAPLAGRSEAVSLLQVAALRFLTLLPAGKVRFTFVDPVGLGESFAAFMHLADFDDVLVSGRVWTEPSEIEARLADLTAHMESVFQKYLRNEFESIEEYNSYAGEVAEPYRILVVANYPAGFTDRAAQRLESIISSGPRCGVFTLLSYDSRQRAPHGINPVEIAAAATVLHWQDGRFSSDALGREPAPLVADVPPPPSLFAAVVRKFGELSKDVRRVEVPFRRIVPVADERWTADSRRTIDVPLGRAGATKLQHLRLGIGTSQHVLVAGKTGSGKSTLLHVLVTNLALRYSPDEVEFFLIDFKKGVEFKAYATQELPHARVIAIESDREFGVSVLERLDAILRTRGDLFRDVGVQDVEGFREARPGIPMPRILLVVDEFQEFFTEDDRYAQTASLLLDRLVRQGRAFGVHVLLGSQTLGGAYSLARTTIGQMAVRIALQCGESDAHLILSEENTAARRLNRPGEAIYNDANGLVEGNSPFQVAWLDDEERDEYLAEIRELARRRRPSVAPPVVFEGNVPADPLRNAALVRRIEAASIGRPDTTSDATTAWIGEAVSITGPTAVSFTPRSGANLLIVGQDSAASIGMLSSCLVALAAAKPVERKEGHLPAFLLFAAGADAARADQWKRVFESSASLVRTVFDDIGGAIVEIAAEIKRRQERKDLLDPIFLVIDGLGRFRELRRAEDDFGFGGFDRERSVSPAKLFGEILRDGPSVAVHTIVWCDSYNTVDRWIGRSMLREFGMRVALPMSATDSSNLIDGPGAGRLGANRAILFLDDQGTTEKFRPYRSPTDEWLDWIGDRLGPSTHDESGGSGELDINEWVIV